MRLWYKIYHIMKRWTYISLLGAVALICCAPTALCLELGEQAPPLKIKKWVKGSSVDLAKNRGKKIYVLEFWATWCGPCKESIPHLTEMQQEHKKDGVVIIGVSDEDP